MLPTPREIQNSPIRLWFVDPYPFPIRPISADAWGSERGLSKRLLEALRQAGEFFDERELEGLAEKLSAGTTVAFDLFNGKGTLLAQKTATNSLLVRAILWGYDKVTARHFGPSRESLTVILRYLWECFGAEKIRIDVVFDGENPPKTAANCLIRSGFKLEGVIRGEAILNGKAANTAIYGRFEEAANGD